MEPFGLSQETLKKICDVFAANEKIHRVIILGRVHWEDISAAQTSI